MKCGSTEYYTHRRPGYEIPNRSCKPCNAANRTLSSRPGVQNRSDRPFKCRKCGSTNHSVAKSGGSKPPKRYCLTCRNAKHTPLKRRVYGVGPKSPAMGVRREKSRWLWKIALRAALIKLAGGKCVVCSYDSNVGALHFDHIFPEQKSFYLNTRQIPVGGLAARKRRLAEFKKCQLLCATHHGEKTWPQYQKKIQLPEYAPWGL